MKLIVGLGNPGQRYEDTRHNIGFMVLDGLAQKLELSFNQNREALEAGSSDVKMIKPQTFMNESGKAVSQIKNYYKIEIDDVWLIYDDVDLEWGKVRISFSGTSAGHKGVQSVIDSLSNENFWRIRVGVGRQENIPTEDWVLKKIEADKMEKFKFIIDRVAELVVQFIDREIKEETIQI